MERIGRKISREEQAGLSKKNNAFLVYNFVDKELKEQL